MLWWCNQPLILETDCLEIVKMIRNEAMDRSVYTTLVEYIKSLLKDSHICFTHIKRIQNISSHFMANYARLNWHTGVWYLSGPEGLVDSCQCFVNSDIPSLMQVLIRKKNSRITLLIYMRH
jgi:hypothetical protein